MIPFQAGQSEAERSVPPFVFPNQFLVLYVRSRCSQLRPLYPLKPGTHRNPPEIRGRFEGGPPRTKRESMKLEARMAYYARIFPWRSTRLFGDIFNRIMNTYQGVLTRGSSWLYYSVPFFSSSV